MKISIESEELFEKIVFDQVTQKIKFVPGADLKVFSERLEENAFRYVIYAPNGRGWAINNKNVQNKKTVIILRHAKAGGGVSVGRYCEYNVHLFIDNITLRHNILHGKPTDWHVKLGGKGHICTCVSITERYEMMQAAELPNQKPPVPFKTNKIDNSISENTSLKRISLSDKFFEAVELKVIPLKPLYRELLNAAGFNSFAAFKFLSANDLNELFAEVESIVDKMAPEPAEKLREIEPTFQQQDWKIPLSFKVAIRSIHGSVAEACSSEFYLSSNEAEEEANEPSPKRSRRDEKIKKGNIERPERKYHCIKRQVLDNELNFMEEKLIRVASELCNDTSVRFELFLTSPPESFPARYKFNCPLLNTDKECKESISCSVAKKGHSIEFGVSSFRRHLKRFHNIRPVENVLIKVETNETVDPLDDSDSDSFFAP